MNRRTARCSLLLVATGCLGLLPACARGIASSSQAKVAASLETEPVPTPGDAADDACLWLHPTDPSRSLIIGTDKTAGLAVYDLRGKLLQFVSTGRFNNVDLRYGFALGGGEVDLVAAGDGATQSIALFRIQPDKRRLVDVSARRIETGLDPYGLCMYRSARNGKYHVFVTSYGGNVEQWELFESSGGKVDARRVRAFRVGGETEGCVADDRLGFLYLAEEDVAIWKYAAEPGPGKGRRAVDRTGRRGHLMPDIEGLALYRGGGGRGYLIASSQEASEFVVYRREGDNEHVGSFRVVAGGEIDGVSGTDGIDVCSFPLGSGFPRGAFIAQDDLNSGGNQNFKLVRWDAIAAAMSPPLLTDTSWNPRQKKDPRQKKE